MSAMLDSRKKETFLHENRFHFPEERNCIVPAIQHGCHANPTIHGSVLVPKLHVHIVYLCQFVSYYYLALSCYFSGICLEKQERFYREKEIMETLGEEEEFQTREEPDTLEGIKARKGRQEKEAVSDALIAYDVLSPLCVLNMQH